MIPRPPRSSTAPTERRDTKRLGDAGPHERCAGPDVSETRDYDLPRGAGRRTYSLHHRQDAMAVQPVGTRSVSRSCPCWCAAESAGRRRASGAALHLRVKCPEQTRALHSGDTRRASVSRTVQRLTAHTGNCRPPDLERSQGAHRRAEITRHDGRWRASGCVGASSMTRS
jgi:hypothetical protein